METIPILMNEHRNIEAGLDALEAFAQQVEQAPLDDEREVLQQFVVFLREYADHYHHAKEEDILFIHMVQSGFPSDHGPISVMRFEHDQGRALVRSLDALATSATPWSDQERSQVFDVAHNFSTLLGDHIEKEDNILYPMAIQQLGEQGGTAVDAEVTRFNNDSQAKEAALMESLNGLLSRFIEVAQTTVDAVLPSEISS